MLYIVWNVQIIIWTASMSDTKLQKFKYKKKTKTEQQVKIKTVQKINDN